jgi:hypothetical protein
MTTPTPPPPTAEPPPAWPPAGPPTAIPPPGGPPSGRRSGTTLALVIGAAVVLLALIAAGTVLLLRADDTEVTTAESEAPVTPIPRPAAGDPDIEVTLRWASTADLDLLVIDPAGDGVSYAQTRVPSGGVLDRDANRECQATTASPLERVSWAEDRAPTGSYFVQVSYPVECPGGEGAQDFQLSVVLGDETIVMLSDRVQPGEVMDLVAFSYPAGIVDDWREFTDAPEPVPVPQPTTPAPPAPEPTPPPAQVPTDIHDLVGGLRCQDLLDMGFPYWDAAGYWELHGRPSRMDADGNGIPCETVYPYEDVRDYWGIWGDTDFEEGGDVPDWEQDWDPEWEPMRFTP